MTPQITVNVASHLAHMAATHPDMPAVHIPIGRVKRTGTTPHRSITFAELNADADAIASGLEKIGIGRGVRTVLMVPPGADFFAITFALFKVAAVPVLIDPGMGIRNLGRCLAEAEPEAFVGIAKANLARRLLGWGKQTIRTTVNVGGWRFGCTRSIEELRDRMSREPRDTLGRSREPSGTNAMEKSRSARGTYQISADDPAAILFTSGSTGPAKGVEYTHGIFAAQIDLLRNTYGIEPGEVDLCTFPLFALFGPALGMTCVVPDMDATRPATIDPAKAIAQIRQFAVTNLFGSPAVIRRLATQQVPQLSTLRRVISAGAPASADSLERISRLLPESVQVFTPYGATESLPVANIGSREILHETRLLTERGKGVCVGRPVDGVTVHIVGISDQPIPIWNNQLALPANTVGEFVIRGPIVTKRYFHRDEATQMAKILDETTGEVLHRMGDVGYCDDQGRLWFCGRKAHRVTTPSGTLFTDMVEPIFNVVPGVGRTALVGVRRGEVAYPVLCVERDMTVKWRVNLTESLLEFARRHPHTASIKTILYHRRFPVDVRHNSKIFREKLAVWADRKLGSKWMGGSA